MQQKRYSEATTRPASTAQHLRGLGSRSLPVAATAHVPSVGNGLSNVGVAFNRKGPSQIPQLWIALNLDDVAIVPGQPISFSVGLTPTGKLDLGNNIVAGLYEVNDQGTPAYPQPNLLWSKDITADLLALKPYETLTIAPGQQSPPPAQFTRIYTVGPHNLAVVLTDKSQIDLPGGPYASASEQLSVVYENIDDSWWQWLDPQLRAFEWKNQPYQVNGRFFNKCVNLGSLKPPTVFQTGAIAFTEIDKTHPKDTSESIVAVNNLSQGGQMDAVVSYVAKNWEWHMPGTYTPDGDIIRTYTYNVLLNNLKDQYGNIYPPRAVPGIAVRVFVSDQKVVADGVAVTAFGVWALFSFLAAAASACIPCAAALSAVASGAATTLGIAGKIADDPPWDDPLYRQPVEVEPPELPAILTSVKRLREVGAFFQLVNRILASVDALNTVANRLTISKNAGDERAVELHISTYRKILEQIAQDAGALDSAAACALPVLSTPHITGHEREAIDPKLPQFSLPRETEGLLDLARRAPLAVGTVTTPPEDHVRNMVAYVHQLASVVQRDAEQVLAS